jgi:TolB-like protein
MMRPYLFAALFVLCLGSILLAQAVPVRAKTPKKAPDAMVICIAPFQDNTNDKQWEGLTAGFSDLLTASFSEHKAVRIVDRTKLAAVLKEHELAYRALTSPETAVRVGKLLGAERMIVGGIMAIDGRPVIAAHVIDIQSTQIIASKKVTGKVEDILALSFKLAAELADTMAIKLTQVAPKDYDKHPMASLHFMHGLGFYHSDNFERAAMEFMVCGDLDPNHPTRSYWLGRCYLQMQEYNHAQIEFRRFLAEYPKSPQAPEARRCLDECDAKAEPAPLGLTVHPQVKPE